MLTKSDHVTLANELRPLILQLNRALRREVAPLGVTAGQVSLLAVISHNEGLSVGALAAREGMSKPAICGYLDRLEASGLIVRVRSQTDRRRVGLELTADGRKLLRAVRSRRTAWLADRMQRLNDVQAAAIQNALEPLALLLSADGEVA